MEINLKKDLRHQKVSRVLRENLKKRKIFQEKLRRKLTISK